MFFFIIISFAAIYLIFCVSANEFTFLGRLKLKIRLYGEKILNYFPSPIKNAIIFIYDYLVYKPNPVVQIFYLLLVLILYLLYYFYGIKIYFPHKEISYNLIYILYTILFFALYIFYLSKSNGKNTLVISNNALKFLAGYGFNIISIPDIESSKSENVINDLKSKFKSSTYTTIIKLDSEEDSELITDLVNKYKAKTLSINSLITNSDTASDYITIQNENISIIRDLLLK